MPLAMRDWTTIKEYHDILFQLYNGIAKITINRPRWRNAFTPDTVDELADAFAYCRDCPRGQEGQEMITPPRRV